MSNLAPGAETDVRRKKAERVLLEQFRKLSDADKKTLLDLAAFLSQRKETGESSAPLPEPEIIPRPAQESVIKAIKRLSASYPMLNRAPLLNETSVLMTQHILHGKDAAEVIDELEALFAAEYQNVKAETPSS